MTDRLKQSERVASLKTPLGDDKLALVRFEGFEGLSELFEFRVDALSTEDNIDFNQALGLPCTATFETHGGEKRHFNGVLVEAQSLGEAHEQFSYRLVLRPSLWLLSRTSNCRIWHDKTALDIIKEVLGDRGVDFRAVVSRECRKREYCVQYRESDLAFVSRLMEDEGIYYFFEHKDGVHTAVLADAPSAHKPVPGLASIRFATVAEDGHLREENLSEWSAERRFRTGKFELRDYNFKTPGNKLVAPAKASSRYAKSDLEFYDYPGGYDTEGEGKSYAEILRDAEQALDWRRYGAGEAPSLFPGGLVEVKEHPKKAENQKYLIVRASHMYTAQAYRSGSSGGGAAEDVYKGNFEFLPSTTPFKAPIVTPKPLVHGPQTARVVQRPNGSGEEIDVDEHGRIRVRFHWDRDDKRSCWVRVAQMWAGNTWGGQFIPRVDMEVVVEFLEGDPDRPLVVGCVYNNDNKYPWSLPDNKTQSGIKSDSSKGHNGYNQIRFEDKKSSEQIEIHAQKYHDVIVEDKETWKIGQNFSADKGPASRDTTLISGDDKLDVQSGNQTVDIKKDQKINVIQNQTIDVKQKISSTGGVEIKLTVGPSSITMDNSGITIKAPLITLDASAITTVKGGMVKVNC